MTTWPTSLDTNREFMCLILLQFFPHSASTCHDEVHICYPWLAFHVHRAEAETSFHSFFIIRRRMNQSRLRTRRGKWLPTAPWLFSLFTHQWRLLVAKRLKLRHRGATFITRGSFVFLAVHCEKAFYRLSQSRRRGIWTHAQAVKRLCGNLCGMHQPLWARC